MKAKRTALISDKNGYGKTAFYEYRGHEYMIHYCNNGCMDDMDIATKHKEEQERIDRLIDSPAVKPKEWKYTGSVNEAFDNFMEYFE